MAEEARRTRPETATCATQRVWHLIHEKFDLVTAKELLRHSSVAITAAHYVENRKRGTTGLGALLATDRKFVPIEESTDMRCAWSKTI